MERARRTDTQPLFPGQESLRIQLGIGRGCRCKHLKGLDVNVISFEDDDITAKKSHIRGICEEIRKRDLKMSWIAHARVDELEPALMAEMKKAGCILLRLGVEAGSERVLKLLKKNPKGLDWKKTCKSIFHEARRLGIATNGLIILGNPEETREEVENTIRLVLELDPDMIQVHFFTPYPGSPAYEDYKEQIEKDQISRMHHYNLPDINLSAISPEVLWKLRGKLYKKLLLRPSFILKHLYHYGPFYLTNPRVFKQLSKVAKII
ncbi:B12-binding domain-containing radical SAM protein [Acidobacteriota bacterium]